MNHLSIFTSLALAGLVAVPAHAETYGEAAKENPELPSHIKTVPRPAPAAPLASSPVASSPVAASASPVAKPQQWHLQAGHLVGQELKRWGKESGWTVLWYFPRDVTVPADTDYPGSFKDAATAVIETLHENGLVIYGDFKDGNQTLIVNGAGPVILDPQ